MHRKIFFPFFKKMLILDDYFFISHLKNPDLNLSPDAGLQ